MPTKRALRTPTLLAVFAALLAGDVGCAHRRPAYYGGDIGPSEGVHVRAPFVDVQVNKKPKAYGEERLSYDDRDDDDDDDD